MSETVAIQTAEAPAASKPRKAAAKRKPSAKAEKGPNRPQVRILKALAKRPLDKEGLSKASNVHMNWVAEYVGGTGGTKVVRGCPKLADAKPPLVKVFAVDETGEVAGNMYEITAAGRKALARAEKA